MVWEKLTRRLPIMKKAPRVILKNRGHADPSLFCVSWGLKCFQSQVLFLSVLHCFKIGVFNSTIDNFMFFCSYLLITPRPFTEKKKVQDLDILIKVIQHFMYPTSTCLDHCIIRGICCRSLCIQPLCFTDHLFQPTATTEIRHNK